MTSVQEVFQMMKADAVLPLEEFEKVLPRQLEARRQLSPEDRKVIKKMAWDDKDLHLDFHYEPSSDDEIVWRENPDMKEFYARRKEISMEVTRALWKHLLGAKITLPDGRTMTVHESCWTEKLGEDGKPWNDERGVGRLIVDEPRFVEADNWRREMAEAYVEISYDDDKNSSEFFILKHSGYSG